MPPATGWRIPFDGPVDESFGMVLLGGHSVTDLEEECRTLQQALSTERIERERLESALQKQKEKVAAAKLKTRPDTRITSLSVGTMGFRV